MRLKKAKPIDTLERAIDTQLKIITNIKVLICLVVVHVICVLLKTDCCFVNEVEGL